jgi:hypothetical protein
MRLGVARGFQRRQSSSAVQVVYSVKRRQALALARPCDNAGSVTASVSPSFRLDQTIFQTLPEGSVLAKLQATKLDSVLEWDPDAEATIETEYAARLPLPHVDDADLRKFMLDECDFAMEHADGSFMEHLQFCRDYTALHYPEGSPRVMLLHSICGVGTNCFPMAAEQLPRLSQLLTPAELAQVEAFPSVLRLLVHGPLLAELASLSGEHPAKLASLRSIQLHRLLDNEAIELSAEQLWEALNYQLIHAVDFLPVAAWERTGNDFFFHVFVELHRLLSRAGRLQARVEWDDSWKRPDMPGARPSTWRHWLIDMIPGSLVTKLASKQVARYSADINHSLDYKLDFAA